MPKKAIEVKVGKKRKQQGGGAKKYDRNKPFCKKYALEGRRAKNKRKRLSRHVRKYPGDLSAQRVFKLL